MQREAKTLKSFKTQKNMVVNAENGSVSNILQNIKLNTVVNAENVGDSNMLLTPRSDIEAHKYTDCGTLGF